MSRFFVEKENIHSDHIVIKGGDVNHIKNVLRLKKGDIIEVCDGAGTDYTVKIQQLEPSSIYTEIISSEKSNTEPPLNFTLYQGIPKGDKMDMVIQKCVELGAAKIVPVITCRTIVRFESPRDKDKKVLRWRKISLEAAKQCNRGIIPEIGYPMQFEEALEHSAGSDLSLIPYEEETSVGIKKYLTGGGINNRIKNISVFIGPEGGFEKEEVMKACSMGIKPVSLGPRILRTETAGAAVLSIIMYELGDMGGKS
ncbi:MAG TPA: 16S rRNA (uracil(1498)-N(3))-methyltransferase [Clostridiaceae bacterium]|nr:16S rRNA (uracil(1498)-N(3))-methyltransferase [Clostridiaceae bacterium]